MLLAIDAGNTNTVFISNLCLYIGYLLVYVKLRFVATLGKYFGYESNIYWFV